MLARSFERFESSDDGGRREDAFEKTVDGGCDPVFDRICLGSDVSRRPTSDLSAAAERFQCHSLYDRRPVPARDTTPVLSQPVEGMERRLAQSRLYHRVLALPRVWAANSRAVVYNAVQSRIYHRPVRCAGPSFRFSDPAQPHQTRGNRRRLAGRDWSVFIDPEPDAQLQHRGPPCIWMRDLLCAANRRHRQVRAAIFGLPLAIVQLATVAVLSWVYTFLFEDWSRAFNLEILLIPEVARGLLITSIFATALAFLAQTALQKQTSSTRVALIFALEPVFAALTSYLWINEVLTGRQILGGLLIFFGMILAELPIGQWLKLSRSRRESEEENRSSA